MKNRVTLRSELGGVVVEVVEAPNAAEALVLVLQKHAAYFDARPFANLCGQAGPVGAVAVKEAQESKPWAKVLREGLQTAGGAAR